MKEACIPFQVLTHTSDEEVAKEGVDFFGYVLAIAQHKMRALELPTSFCHPGLSSGSSHNYLFVLTADTLVRTVHSNQIFGKPSDERDARRMLRILRDEPAEVATGCCLEKKIWNGAAWQTHDARLWTISAVVEFFIDEDSVDEYFKKMPQAFQSSGTAIIEGFGQNFFKSIQGSYTATKGLPIFELRQTLKTLGFRF